MLQGGRPRSAGGEGGFQGAQGGSAASGIRGGGGSEGVAKDGAHAAEGASRIEYPDGKVYQGELKPGGRKHGRGMLTWPNGNKYVGDFKDDRLHGQGTMRVAKSGKGARQGQGRELVYEGWWRNGQKHGKGRETLADGSTFTGTYQNGAFEAGVLDSSTGRRYEGEFGEGGQRHGRGSECWPDGTTYVGEYQRGSPHGSGKKVESDGRQYEGEWAGGKKTGQGCMRWPDGKLYTGAWKSDAQSGKGTLTAENGVTYTGFFKQGRYHGHGVQVLALGTRYEGEWKSGMMHGKGVQTGSDGMIYDGMWQDNLFDGIGTLTWPDQRKYEGSFAKHKLQGEGTCTWPSGRKFIGRFKNDKMCDGELWEADGTISEVVCDQTQSFWLGEEPILKSQKVVSSVQERRRQAALQEASRVQALDGSLVSDLTLQDPDLEWQDVWEGTRGLMLPIQGWYGDDGLFLSRHVKSRPCCTVRIVRAEAVAAGALELEMAALSAVERAGWHPNIITVRGVCRAERAHDGGICIAYELPFATSLTALLSSAPSLAFTWKRRVRMMACVTSALSFLHDKAMVFHACFRRDYVLASPSFEPKLLCLDACCRVGALDAEAPQIRPGYQICPRAAKTGRHSERSLVYSLGVVVLELITGTLSSADRDLALVFVEDEDEDLSVAADKSAGVWDAAAWESVCSVARECVGAFKKRPSLEELSKRLSDLCEGPCSLSEAERDEDAGFHEAAARLEAGVTSAGARASAAEAVADKSPGVALASHQRAAAGERTCAVCLDDDCPVSTSVLCSGSTRHLLCQTCFSAHVTAESHAEQSQLKQRAGRVFCPFVKNGDCEAAAYSDQEIALRVPGEVYSEYMQAQRRLIEQRVMDELRPTLVKELRSDIGQGRIESLRKKIIDSILTLKCPNKGCQQAFVDFDGCFALACNKCSHLFCGYCFFLFEADQSERAHSHVGKCQWNEAPNKDIFATLDVFDKVQNKRKIRKLREFLRRHDGHVRDALMEALAKDLSDIGISVDSLKGLDTSPGVTGSRRFGNYFPP